MKKLIFLLPLFLLLQSCEKDDSDIFGDSSKNSYTICFNVDWDTALKNQLGRYYSYHNADLYIAEYNSDNERVAIHKWENVRKGDSREFTACERAIKLTIQSNVTIYGNNNEELYRHSKFVANVFYLDEYNYIEIKGNTPSSEDNPIN